MKCNIGDCINIILGFAALLSAAIAHKANRDANKHFKKSREPQLAFKLFRGANMLYLEIRNAGQTAATEIFDSVKFLWSFWLLFLHHFGFKESVKVFL